MPHDHAENESERRALFGRLNEVVRRFQRVSGFGLRSYGKGVTRTVRDHTIAFIGCHPGCSEDSIVRALRAPQATISRTLRVLGAEGVITLERASKDRRHLSVSLSLLGAREYLGNLATTWRIYEDLIAVLRESERSELLDLQREFADLLGAEQLRGDNEMFAMQQRVLRITWGLDLMRADPLRGFNLSALSWNFLVIIAQHPKMVSARYLRDLFNAPKNTVASALRELETRGLIKSVVTKEDKRVKQITITTSGSDLLAQIRQSQVDHLTTRCQAMETSRLRRLVELSEAYLAPSESAPEESILAPRVALRALVSTEAARARRILEVSRGSDSPPVTELPSQYLDSFVGLFSERTLAGVARVTIESDGPRLLELVVFSSEVSAEVERGLRDRVCEFVLSRARLSG